MPCYVGLDSSKKWTSVCVLDRHGRLVKEGQVESTPAAIVSFLRGERIRYARVGIEAWSMAGWLYEGLARAGLPIICIEAGHAHNVLKTQPNKTDKADARGIAELMRIGSYKAVHVKTRESQRLRTMIGVRRLLKAKQIDIQQAISGVMLGLGLKLERGLRGGFEARVAHLIKKDEVAAALLRPLLDVRATLIEKISEVEATVQQMAKRDPVCELLMTAPGVGAVTAVAFRATVDVPERFANSRSVGPHLGLVPRTHQSGDVEWRGRISKRGDHQLRVLLYFSALRILQKNMNTSWLKRWGEQVALRRGGAKAAIALARRLAVVLHRMWITDTPFQWELAR